MKIIYTNHAEEKLLVLQKEGWNINKSTIKKIIINPKWKGTTKEDQETAIGLVDNDHILRIVLDRQGDIIKVITFHLGKRGRYESTL